MNIEYEHFQDIIVHLEMEIHNTQSLCKDYFMKRGVLLTRRCPIEDGLGLAELVIDPIFEEMEVIVQTNDIHQLKDIDLGWKQNEDIFFISQYLRKVQLFLNNCGEVIVQSVKIRKISAHIDYNSEIKSLVHFFVGNNYRKYILTDIEVLGCYEGFTIFRKNVDSFEFDLRHEKAGKQNECYIDSRCGKIVVKTGTLYEMIMMVRSFFAMLKSVRILCGTQRRLFTQQMHGPRIH